MALEVCTAPAALPVTVAELKSFARIDFDDDDALLATLIEAARDHFEQASSRTFVPTTYKWSSRTFSDLIYLPRAPLISVQYVKYRDNEGNSVSLVADTDYLLDYAAEPATIEPVKSWPRNGDYHDAVQVRFIAGYPGDDGSPPDLAANVPARAKVAIKALATHWYEQREPVAFSQPHEVPYHVTRLINGLKVWR